MIYLHATDERHREIADSLSAMAKAELKKAGGNRSGTQRARRRKKRS
ncbi:MAG: Phage integrase family protein [Streptosporangiaceae bacterium]|nr:Phage integrase family protein [Streptosporangiaceae bacterium]